MITIVSTDSGRIDYRTLGDTERIFLEQALAFDGATAVEDVRNASGRIVGQHYTITDSTWDFVSECAAATAGA